jgi:hypothetical protein
MHLQPLMLEIPGHLLMPLIIENQQSNLCDLIELSAHSIADSRRDVIASVSEATLGIQRPASNGLVGNEAGACEQFKLCLNCCLAATRDSLDPTL